MDTIALARCGKCGTSQRNDGLQPCCLVCGSHLHALAGHEGPGSVPVWEELDSRGLFRAFFATLSLVLFHPDRFFSRLALAPASAGKALLYALVASALGILASFLIYWLEPQTYALTSSWSSINAVSATTLIYFPLITAANCIVSALYAHLALAVTGSRGISFKRTFTTVCYAQSAMIISFVPGIGPLLASLWMLFSMVSGLARLHNRGRIHICFNLALPAVLIGMIVLCIVLIFVSAGIFSLGMTQDYLDFFR